jgi:predicted nuclease with TOPRIM domain
MDFRNMGLDGDKNSLLKEIEDLESEIEEIKKRIPPHSVRYEIIQLLEEKERDLGSKKDLHHEYKDVKKG